MKKLFLVATLLTVAGCQQNPCEECQQPQVQAPCPACNVTAEPVYRAPARVTAAPCEEVSVPVTRTTTTYKIIEYRKPAVEVVRVQPAEYKRVKYVSEPVVEVINKPAEYRASRPVEYRTTTTNTTTRPVEYREVVKQPTKLVAPTKEWEYYTEDDWVK